MTSKQVLLILGLIVLGLIPGCETATSLSTHWPFGKSEAPLVSPYAQRQVWAVAPFRNESGSRHVDVYRVADRVTEQLTLVDGIDVIPVNRVIDAMQALEMSAVTSREDAMQLRQMLGVDALVIGSVTAYDPYRPMKLGMAVDLYVQPSLTSRVDVRGLAWVPTGDAAGIDWHSTYRNQQPVTVVSGYFDVSAPAVSDQLDAYVAGRSAGGNTAHQRRIYTLDMNLYTEFVSYLVSSKLVYAEWQRVAPEEVEPTKPAKPAESVHEYTEYY